MRSKNFLLDLAALVPLDLLQLKLGTQPLLRFPRFFKVWHRAHELKRFILMNFMAFAHQVYRLIKFYYIVESRTVWPNLWRVVNLIHILLILAHWFGCFYFLLSEAEGFQVRWWIEKYVKSNFTYTRFAGWLGVSVSTRRLCNAVA